MTSGINQSRNYKYRRLSNTESKYSDGFTGVNGAEEYECDEYELQRREVNNRTKYQQNRSNCSTSSPEKDIILVDKPIVAGESLASISLKYRISISELKRVNKIQKDIEFYALANVKIPVRTNSSLLDIISDEMHSGTPQISKEIEQREPLDDSCINAVKSSLAQMETSFLNEDVQLPRGSLASHNVNLHPTAEDQVLSTCSGADWDLSWWKVLLIGVLLILGVPLIYYIYYEQKKNK